jgi:hypothetical protein
MGADELKRLMAELHDLCRVHGQQKRVAEAIGVYVGLACIIAGTACQIYASLAIN